MLKRIYLDNILSFVNFEWSPDKLVIIMGGNGTGKTNIVNVLSDLQLFLMGDNTLQQSFPLSSKTRWDTRTDQTVELDIMTEHGLATYRLVVTHNERDKKAIIKEESVRISERHLISLQNGELQLYRDNGSQGPKLFYTWSRSILSNANDSKDATHLMAFKKAIMNLWFLIPNPRAITSKLTENAKDWLEKDFSNFSDWYFQVFKEKPKLVFKSWQDISEILEGFSELHEHHEKLYAKFEWNGKPISFKLEELSDGQRLIIVLYVLSNVVTTGPGLLVLDEPDNFIALAEIQPFLLKLVDASLKTDGTQVWLISHHPESLNLLAVEYGYKFFRDNGGPTRVERFTTVETMTAAETVARGWE